LRDRLVRAGFGPAEVEETLGALRDAGLLDDKRLALRRAEVLAERGQSDAAIRFDLARKGVSDELVERAVMELEPERERVERILSRRGVGPKTARLLARRGFDHDLVDLAAGGDVAREA
jgi:regulatory protein